MHFIFSDFADKYYQLKKMNKREIGSSILRMFSPRRYLSRMRSILLIIFTALPHLHVRHVGLIRRPLSFPGENFS